jgi:hypothetical protein
VVEEGNSHLFHALTTALQQSSISCSILADLSIFACSPANQDSLKQGKMRWGIALEQSFFCILTNFDAPTQILMQRDKFFALRQIFLHSAAEPCVKLTYLEPLVE